MIHGLLTRNLQKLNHLILDVNLDHDLKHEGWSSVEKIVLHLRYLVVHGHKEQHEDTQKSEDVIGDCSTYAVY